MKIAVIGGGGIGSSLVRALHELVVKNQLLDADITVFDDDGVEETNILYQDFSMEDVLENKAVALADRYSVRPVPDRVNSQDVIKEYEFIACCVDNTKTRKLIYKTCYQAKGPDFVDLRSEGKAIAAFTKKGNNLKKLLATLPEEDVEDGSCQLESDKKAGTMQQGNKVVALIGSQVILDRSRGINNPLNIRQTL